MGKGEDVIKRPNSFQREILRTQHPFERNGMTSGKKLSVLQKAMTYYIMKNGPWVSEDALVKFLTDNWDEIMQISPQKFAWGPGLRILRAQTVKRKNGELLFPMNSAKQIGINTVRNKNAIGADSESEGTEEGNENDWKEEEEESTPETPTEEKHAIVVDIRPSKKDVSSRVDRNKNDNQNIAKEDLPFEGRLLEYIENEKAGVSENVLKELMRKHSSAEGRYYHLPFERRVRACLLSLKTARLAFFDENIGLWNKIPVKSRGLKIDYRHVPVEKYNVKKLNIDDLWRLLCEEANGKMRE
jgi:hypothetical protein